MSVQTHSTLTSASARVSGWTAESDPSNGRILTAIALASLAAGAINLAAALTVGRNAVDTLAFFLAATAAQAVWGAAALVRAPRWWLALGAVGNFVVAATWAVSRTVGLPFGTYAGSVLSVGFPDGLATALEIAVVIGAVLLVIRGVSLTRPAARSARATATSVLIIGALALVGVLGQTGAIGSSSNGSQSSGGGAPANSSAPAPGGIYNY
jgi:hypothetical protein